MRDVTDEITEECDDGLGGEADLCTDDCQVADTAVVRLPVTVPIPEDLANRYLGEGRHPIAGSQYGFGVAFVESGFDPPVIGLSVFDPAGDPRARIVLSDGADPVLFANPVVAALPNGDYAAAWTDFDGDGDELGVALRRVTPAPVPGDGMDPPVAGVALGATLSPLGFANGETLFSQYDADLIAVGATLIAAWTDNTDPETAPDIRFRTFSGAGVPGAPFAATSSDGILSATSDVEGNVALAAFGASFAAAWRSGKPDGRETIEVLAAQGNQRWSVSTTGSGHLPGAAEDRPALAEIDATHLLLLFTEGTDPLGTTVANVGRLRAAILDTANPGEPAVFAINPQAAGYASPDIAQAQPNLARVGDRWYTAWRSASLAGDANGEEIWLARIQPVISGGEAELVVDAEIRIPRFAPGSLGDQRFAGLAAVPELLGTQGLPGPAPDGGLALAWTDYGQTLGPAQGQPDVLAAFFPEPITRFPQHVDCSVAVPCGPGDGDCDSNDECLPGLICPVNSGNGPNFGLGPDVDACVVAHCNNGIQDADETNIDCGGAECGQCLCGDGIPMPIVGEECDDAGDSPDCDFDCTLPECGDSHHNSQAGEACDSGGVNTAGCDSDCTAPVCGDSLENTAAGEECDDGNLANNDGCVGTCDDARCGDGFVRTVGGTEACDTAGNSATCDDDCTAVMCGDGFVNPAAGELCEPSLDPNCRSDCHGFLACTNPLTCALVIEHIGGTQPTDNHANVQLRIRNRTALPVPVNQLKVRYWLTRYDDTLACTSPLSLSTPCDWPNPVNGVCPGVALAVSNVSPLLDKVDTLVEATLSGAETIAANGFKDINFRITRTISGNLNENNDYSYQSGSTHIANTKIGLYQNNQLVWGVEPTTVRFCGDGITSGCETCDTSGNTLNCDSDCTARVCGDGFINSAAGETCEPSPPPESANCDSDCTARSCGDSHVNPFGNEICEPSIKVADCANHCGAPACTSPAPTGCNNSCNGFTTGCTNGNVCLKIQYRPGPGDSAMDNQVRPHLKLVNNGFAPLALSTLRIRYYFTIDGSATLQHNCDYASLPGGGSCANVTRTFATISRPNADRYLEVGFTGSGTLAPCESAEMQLRFNKSTWTNFNETNDWSYQSTSSFVDRTRIVVLRNNQVIWGTPP